MAGLERFQFTDQEIIDFATTEGITQVLDFISDTSYEAPANLRAEFEDLRYILQGLSSPDMIADTQQPLASDEDMTIGYFVWRSIRLIKQLLDQNSGVEHNLRTDLSQRIDRKLADQILNLVDRYEDNEDQIDEAITAYATQEEALREAVKAQNLREYRQRRGLLGQEELRDAYVKYGKDHIDYLRGTLEKDLEGAIESIFEQLISWYSDNEELFRLDRSDRLRRIEGLKALRARCLVNKSQTSVLGGTLLNVIDFLNTDLNKSGVERLTKEITDLSARISDIERRLQRNYLEVGRFLSDLKRV